MKQQQDINAITKGVNEGLSEKAEKDIDKIKNRALLPGKTWFLQQKPGKYILLENQKY